MLSELHCIEPSLTSGVPVQVGDVACGPLTHSNSFTAHHIVNIHKVVIGSNSHVFTRTWNKIKRYFQQVQTQDTPWKYPNLCLAQLSSHQGRSECQKSHPSCGEKTPSPPACLRWRLKNFRHLDRQLELSHLERKNSTDHLGAVRRHRQVTTLGHLNRCNSLCN